MVKRYKYEVVFEEIVVINYSKQFLLSLPFQSWISSLSTALKVDLTFYRAAWNADAV